MPPISTSIDVDRPAEEVFAYATDPTRFSEWQKGVVSGNMEAPGTPSVGTRCLTTRRIGFANRPVTAEVTHIDPPRTWGVRGIDGPIRAIVDLAVEPLTATKSRLTITIDFKGHGIGKLLVPLVVEREARKEMPANLLALKERLERGVTAPYRTVRPDRLQRERGDTSVSGPYAPERTNPAAWSLMRSRDRGRRRLSPSVAQRPDDDGSANEGGQNPVRDSG